MNKIKSLYKKLKEIINSVKNPGVVYDFNFKFKTKGNDEGFNSQRGQDYYIMSEVFHFKKNGYFVDVGANHPLNENNTLILEKKYNWMGLSIDPIPKFKNLWNNERESKFINACIGDVDNVTVEFTEILSDNWESMLSGVNVQSNNKFKSLTPENVKIHTMQTKKLSSLLPEHEINKIDLLFIDTEGFEMNVLKGIDFSKTSIQCICLENDNQDKEIRNYLFQNGYTLKAHIMGDDIFIKKNSL